MGRVRKLAEAVSKFLMVIAAMWAFISRQSEL